MNELYQLKKKWDKKIKNDCKYKSMAKKKKKKKRRSIKTKKSIFYRTHRIG